MIGIALRGMAVRGTADVLQTGGRARSRSSAARNRLPNAALLTAPAARHSHACVDLMFDCSAPCSQALVSLSMSLSSSDHLRRFVPTAQAFTSLSLFTVLRMPLFQLPQLISQVINARVALNRIQAFLAADEQPDIPLQPAVAAGELVHA